MKKNYKEIGRKAALTGAALAIALGLGADRAAAQGGGEDDQPEAPLPHIVPGEVPPPGEEEAEPNLDPVLLNTATQTLVLDAKSWEGIPPENVPKVEAYSEDMLTAYQVNSEWRAVSKNTPGLQGISFIDFLNRRAAGERMEMSYVARNIKTREVIKVTQELGPLTFTGSPDDGSLKITLDTDANPQYEIHVADITYYDMPLTYGWGAGSRSGHFFDPNNPTKVIMYATVPANDLWQPPFPGTDQFPGYDQWWYDEASLLSMVTLGFNPMTFALEDQEAAHEGKFSSAIQIPGGNNPPGSPSYEAAYKYIFYFHEEGQPPTLAINFVPSGPHPEE